MNNDLKQFLSEKRAAFLIEEEKEYPLWLCVEMIRYCTWSNDLTKDINVSEIYKKLEVFFTVDQIKKGKKILCGELEGLRVGEDYER